MALSQKVKSIGFRTTGGMALLLISVVLVAVVGIRGMGSLTGAVTQTVDTSKVLIGANKAEGAIIQYLVSKDPKWIDEAGRRPRYGPIQAQTRLLFPQARNPNSPAGSPRHPTR